MGAQENGLTDKSDVASITAIKQALTAKKGTPALKATIAVRDGQVKIINNGYFLKGFFKHALNFHWVPEDNTWSKDISDEDTEVSRLKLTSRSSWMSGAIR